MTRKKQGAPQKLNSQTDTTTKNSSTNGLSPDCAKETMKNKMSNGSPRIEPEVSNNLDTKRKNQIEVSRASNQTSSSCQKLLNFTQNFSFSNGIDQHPSVKEETKSESCFWSGPKHDISTTNSSNSSHSISSTNTENNLNCNYTHGFDSSSRSQLSSEGPSSSGSVSKLRDGTAVSSFENDVSTSKISDQPIKCEQVEFNKLASQFQSDPLKGIDMASFTAAQQLIMDAMQKQLYEQCSNNWMNVQRADNNCLSKSKAERYRWCVQDGQHKSSSRSPGFSQSHVSSLKKSASMAGIGVTPVQDKLYSTVFTGASKFCCRDCGNPFNTLVDLTVHMNKTGHFRDSNNGGKKTEAVKDATVVPSEQKLKRRPTPEDESQSEKVLTCMGCGHLFESLQDLSVHMIKTKHYENVPSLRMLSQKQPLPPDNSARKRSLSTMTTSQSKKNDVTSFPIGFDQQLLNRSQFDMSSYMPGFNNSAAIAAAYTNLLYSSPWFGSLPPSPFSLYANSAALPYPYMYPPGLVAGSFPFPFPSVNEEQEMKLFCSKCKETFKSFQDLMEHIQKTSHYPDFDMNILQGFPSKSPSMSPSNSPDSSSVKSKISRVLANTAAAKPPSSSGETAFNHSTSVQKSPRDEPKKLTPDSSSTPQNFDFIRSLESTIKSAISKVESPKSNDSTLMGRYSSSERQNNFSPFFSSISESTKPEPSKTVESHSSTLKQSFMKLKEKDFVKPKDTFPPSKSASIAIKTETKNSQAMLVDSNQLSSGSHSSTTEPVRTKTGKCDSPLDLTLKRDMANRDEILTRSCDTRVSTKPFSNGLKSSQDSVKVTKKESTSDSSSGVFKSPLQCLRDDMQNFFSLMKPKTETNTVRNDTSSPSAISPPKNCPKASSSFLDSYKPIIMPESFSRPSSNPLQEILKIVNNTDLAKPRTASQESRVSPTSTSTKRAFSDNSSPVDSKKSKFSLLLRDLVVPKDDMPMSSANPLKKIQDLVDNKLNRPEEAAKKTMIAPPNGVVNTHVIKSAARDSNHSSSQAAASSSFSSFNTASNAASALLSLRFSSPNSFQQSTHVNGLHRSLTPSPEKSQTQNRSKNPNISKSNSADSISEDVDDVSLEELQLEAAFARIVSSDAASFSNEEFSKYLDLSSDKIKTWFVRMMQEFRSSGRLPFLRCHNDDSGAKRVELLCRRCGAVCDSCESFSTHVKDHLELNKVDCKSEVDSPRSEIRGKCTIQGSVCIGSYNSFEKVLSPDALYECEEKSDLEINPQNHNLLLHHQRRPGRCSDETSSSADDGIIASS